MGPIPKTLMKGKLKCGACGDKLRDHEGMGPCPFWEAGSVDYETYMKQMVGRKRSRT